MNERIGQDRTPNLSESPGLVVRGGPNTRRAEVMVSCVRNHRDVVHGRPCCRNDTIMGVNDRASRRRIGIAMQPSI
jgi:hypothetical protein